MCNDRQIQSDWGVINGIRVNHHDFTGVYRSVKNDTIVYGSGMWVRTHDA
jgi:hypothetical protein